MLHANPLLRDISCDKKFITVGEIMLRLTPPNYEKLRMANNFEASYGGSEANIALALANLGIDSTFFSVVPNNSLGKSAVRLLRSNDVHCTPMILSTPEETPSHRLGTYYLETGYGVRPLWRNMTFRMWTCPRCWMALTGCTCPASRRRWARTAHS